ncbi:Transcriptional regulator OS=Streptomyces paromomycinus OX=92743 GN=GKJPGBOP_01557 PE=4 SV=1 [Streptomyces rimosus subsp. rimosus]
MLRHPAEAGMGLTVASLLTLLVQDEAERTAQPNDPSHHSTA